MTPGQPVKMLSTFDILHLSVAGYCPWFVRRMNSTGLWVELYHLDLIKQYSKKAQVMFPCYCMVKLVSDDEMALQHERRRATQY